MRYDEVRQIASILDYFGVEHTRQFVQKMLRDNPMRGNLLGIVRMLGAFGITYRGARWNSSAVYSVSGSAFLCSHGGNGFAFVTGITEDTVYFIDSSGTALQESLAEFEGKVSDVIAVLDRRTEAAEPMYREHRRTILLRNVLICFPLLLGIWLVVRPLIPVNTDTAATAGTAVRLILLALSGVGILACVMLHREWLGTGSAVDKICSLFRTSDCSSAHDSFFFNVWFDLSELGLSFFLTAAIWLMLVPDRCAAVSWMVLPALPFTLWNVWYQLFRQKKWCPLCLSVQVLLWIMALVCLVTGQFTAGHFLMSDMVTLGLTWLASFAFILLVVTPWIQSEVNVEESRDALAELKGDRSVCSLMQRLPEKDVHSLMLVVSPTCPFCRKTMETVSLVLMPSGRFSLEVIHVAVHEGDREMIEAMIGREEAERQAELCESLGIDATPTMFVDGMKCSRHLDAGDLLYL